MGACRRWRDAFAEAVLGEADEGLQAHLAGCPRCAAELAELRAALEVVESGLPPRPRPGELDVYASIAPRLDAIDAARERRPARLVVGYPLAALAAAALVAAGLGLGLLLRPAPPVVTFTADAELASFLEEATPLLLAVANRRADGGTVAAYEAAAERRLADGLAERAGSLRAVLEERGEHRRAGLAADLEIVFLQLANLPERGYGRGVAVVQATIESRALFFQISVEEMRGLAAGDV